jgi:hypothetical protein
MLFKVLSAAVYGIDAYPVEVEVDVGSSKMGEFTVVGLPDIAVKESRERIRSALKNCGYDFPFPQSVTVNLAPADIRKEGSAFDLPMALGIFRLPGGIFREGAHRRGVSGRATAGWCCALSSRSALGGFGGARTRNEKAGRAESKCSRSRGGAGH